MADSIQIIADTGYGPSGCLITLTMPKDAGRISEVQGLLATWARQDKRAKERKETEHLTNYFQCEECFTRWKAEKKESNCPDCVTEPGTLLEGYWECHRCGCIDNEQCICYAR
jgi:hypothetical protein